MSVIEVAIGPGSAPDRFLVQVVRSPAGEASAEASLDSAGLLARRSTLQQALLASSVSARQILTESEETLRSAGQELFTALLGTGEVAGRYRASAAVSAERGEGLRVVLRIGAPELAGLPWEAMYDRATGAYVARHDQLVRHVPVPSVPAPLLVDPPLRILGVVSSPRGLPLLDTEKEQEQLAAALARPVSQGLAEVHWAPSATWADLHGTLLDGQWHMFHFIGHGDFDPAQDEGILALTRPDGRADLVEASRLTDLLRQARPVPRLVVLNSCSGAETSTNDLFSGTAAALVRGGISAVAAMQYAISDPAAVAFTRGFYTAIAHGRGVDDAVSSGRVAILGTTSHTLEWATPVLYLRGHDTRLFTIQPAPATKTAPPPAERDSTDDVSAAARDQPTRTSNGETTATHDAPAAGPAQPRIRERLAAPAQPSPPPAAPGPSRLARTLSHKSSMHGVAFSPDGTLLATSSGLIWEVSTGNQVRELNDILQTVAFSPDGTLLATAGFDKTARLRDVATGKRVRKLNHTDLVNWVAFSPDGTLLATASDDDTDDLPARLWDVATGKRVRTLTGHTNDVNCAAFSPDGTLLATASDDKTARLWDVATGKPLRTLTGHTWDVTGVAFSPDGTLLATASFDKTARLWDAATGKRVRTLTGHTDVVAGVAFSPDGTLLATASWDKTVRIWD